MILESDHTIWRKARVHLLSSYFEFKQMSPRQFGPYTLIKNHSVPYGIDESPEVIYPYIYDFEDYFDKNYESIVIGLIRKTMA